MPRTVRMVRVDGQHDPAESAFDQIAEQQSGDGRRVPLAPTTAIACGG